MPISCQIHFARQARVCAPEEAANRSGAGQTDVHLALILHVEERLADSKCPIFTKECIKIVIYSLKHSGSLERFPLNICPQTHSFRRIHCAELQCYVSPTQSNTVGLSGTISTQSSPSPSARVKIVTFTLQKMLSFALLSFASCEWWDFDPSGFDQKISESKEKPLFIFAFSARCPHCRGLPPRFEEFGKNLDIGAPVVLTNLNCTQYQDQCGKLPVMSVPSWYFFENPRQRYIVQIPRNEQAWRDWLVQHVKVSSDVNDKLRSKVLAEVDKGNSVFRLVAKTENTAAREAFDRKKEEVGDENRFVTETGDNESITAYLSPKCSCTGRMDNIEQFIEENVFGSFWKYDYPTWKRMTGMRRTATLFVQSRMNAQERAILGLIAEKLCCKYAVGWAPIGRAFKILAELIHGDQSSAFLAVKDGDCSYALRDEITEASVSRWIDELLAGRLPCEAEMGKASMPNSERGSAKPYALGMMSIVGLVGLGMFARRRLTVGQAKDE